MRKMLQAVLLGFVISCLGCQPSDESVYPRGANIRLRGNIRGIKSPDGKWGVFMINCGAASDLDPNCFDLMLMGVSPETQSAAPLSLYRTIGVRFDLRRIPHAYWTGENEFIIEGVGSFSPDQASASFVFSPENKDDRPAK